MSILSSFFSFNGGKRLGQGPTISLDTATPELVEFSFGQTPGYTDYEWDYDNNEEFGSFNSGTGNPAVINGYGLGFLFIRVRGVNPTTGQKTKYTILSTEIVSGQLRSLTIAAQGADGEVRILHDCQASEPNVDFVSVQRRIAGVGEFLEIDTFTPQTTPYVDTNVVNDTDYEYRFEMVADNVDFQNSFSNISSATPTGGTVTLAQPILLNMDWDDTNAGEGIFFFVDASGEADAFEITIKNGATTVDSGTVNLPGNTYPVTGLTSGVNYTFEVFVTATGFNDSAVSSIQSVAIDPNGIVIDMESDHGMEAYYLPLDGRQVEGFDFPLSNIEPLGNGTSRVTAVTNDGLGTTVNNVFDASVVGKTFVAIDAHLNGDIGVFIDEFVPNSISPRYATVTDYDNVNGAFVIVDFEYNGGNIGTPQNTLNCLSYIGKDNTNEWKNCVQDWYNLGRPTDIIGQPFSRSGYILNVYYVREWTAVELNIAKDFYLGTSDGSPMRIKHGVEERYRGLIDHFGGQTFWDDSPDMFIPTNYANKAVTHNVEFISEHKTYVPTEKYMMRGNLTTGVFMCIGNYTKREWGELDAGFGFDTDKLLWTMASSFGNCVGTFIGSGETFDVDEFGFNVHINCDYDGVNSMGYTSGPTRGSHYNIYDNVAINFNPQDRWSPPTQRLNLRMTNDFTGINDTGDVFDPATHTAYLPSHCVETDNGNYYRTRYMGGHNRLSLINIGKFFFSFNNPRYNQIDSYYNLCYNNNLTTLPIGSTPVFGSPNGGKYTLSNKKALVEWEIPTAGSVRTMARKCHLNIPKFGSLSTVDGERSPVPQIAAFAENGLVSHINWGLTFGKYADDFTAAELTYISQVNRKPCHPQVDDTFKILAWVEVADTTGFVPGQNVTIRDNSNATITTGTVHEIDDVLFTNRIKIKGATVNVNGANNITNGTQTSNITAASNYDPEQVYTFVRFQGAEESDLFDGVKGAAGGYGTGFAQNSSRRIDGYTPWEWYIAPDLPQVITGAEGANDTNTTNVIFELEFITSQAEVLLDGQYREAQLTYKGYPRMGGPLVNYTYQYDVDPPTKRMPTYGVARGTGNSYQGGVDNRQTGFLVPDDWPSSGSPQGHAAYNRAEITWYVRMPVGWQNSPWRNSLVNPGNNSSLRPGGNTSYQEGDLSRWSKGITIIGEVSGYQNLLRAESGSSRGQFATTQTLYDDNPGYVPQYAIDEEMLPPDESAPYVPKVRVYGQTAIDWVQGTGNDYIGETVFNTDLNDAPDLPKTIKDILTAIGE